jgi:type VI secretion system secreted protein Hcp
MGQMNGNAISKCVYTYSMAILGAGLVLAPAAFAGPLEPAGPPASSSVTLNELDAGIKDIHKATAQLAKRGVPGGLDVPDDPGAVDPTDGTEALSVTMQFTMDNGLPPIEGSVTTEGYEGQVSVRSFSHSITTPRDAASGLPTGRRQHQPFRFTKVYDKASPILAKACAQGTHIKSAKLFVRKASGEPNPYYTITLGECIVTGISTGFPNYEEIEIVYENIAWTDEASGTTAVDSWTESPTGK